MSGYDPEAQSMLGTSDITLKDKSTSAKVCQALCGFAVSGSIAIYGLYIDSKFKGNQNAQCAADLMWIKCFAIVTLVTTGLPLLAAPFSNEGNITKMSQGTVALGGLFSFVWAIYGIVEFFKDPVCNEQEIHMFGKVLSWFFVIGMSLACCGACAMVGKLVSM